MNYCSRILSAILIAYKASDVLATFTIAAADSSTGQVGASGSSCVALSLYTAAYHSVPGHGICMTQALPAKNMAWNPYATFTSPVYEVIDDLLAADTDPSAIIDCITDKRVDVEEVQEDATGDIMDGVDVRQYGCVNVLGESAGYTGKDIRKMYYSMMSGKESNQDIQGTYGDIVYTAQGNIVSRTAVSTLSDTFTEDGACDLVERLYNSLAAVFESQELIGDMRCFDKNHAAGSTLFIHVDNADGTEVIHIQNENPDDYVNPWEEFQTEYDEWRSKNPCPSDLKYSAAVPF